MNKLQEALDYLKIYGGDIGKKAKEGSLLCKYIMSCYKMVYECQEQGSIAMLLDAIEEYRKGEINNENCH